MVSGNKTQKSHSGYRDWIIQRVSALYMAVFAISLAIYLLSGPVSYDSWRAVFSLTSIKITSVLFVLSVVWHAWIGLWTVFTDYVNPPKIRLTLQAILLILLAFYLVWVVGIVW